MIGAYKTSRKYSAVEHPLPKKLEKEVRAYIAAHGLKIGDRLFGAPQLSKFCGETNKALGYTDGVKLFRQMSVTAELNSIDPPPTPDRRVQLAKLMGHSIVSQLMYLRQTEVVE